MGAGERLKARREALGRAIPDVSTDLRISSKYLRGIEEGHYEGFPARVFSVGFIKSYAAFLEEDPEPVIQEYGDYAGDSTGPDSHNPVAVGSQWVEKARERGNRMLYYILAALVVLLIGSGLSWYSSRPIPPPGISPIAIPVVDNRIPATSPAGDNLANREGRNGSLLSVPDNTATPLLQPDIAPYQLYLEANDQTWLMYSLDDDEPLDTMLYPGDKLSIQARRKIFLKLGNAGGVIGTLNGRRMPEFGGRGQVRVVTMGK